MTVKAKVGSAVAGKDVVNKASVNGAQPDPTPANNTTTKSLPVAPVDLVTTKELVGAAVQGQRASYKVTVKNVGGSPASGVTIQDTLGAGLSAGTYAFSPAGAGTCTSAGVCTLSGTLAPGASAVVTVSASVASNATSVTNTAAATSTEPDLTPGDNTATVTSPTTASADLSLVKTADPVNPSAGQDVTYTLAVANAGPSPATGVVITDPLPTGVTFKSASAGCTLSSGTVTCTVGTVAAGASATRTITVTVTDAAPPNVRNTAHVAATTADPNPLNNDGAADITVPDNADGQLTKTASPASAKPGETVTYTLVYRNNGPATAKDVKLADPLPGGVSFASASAGCVNASGSVTCSLGDVPSGASRTVTITTTVDPVALPADHQHDLAIDKREAFVGLTGGQTGAFAVSCGSDYIATDGSVRTDDVFNTDGTRAYDALDVISLQSTADGSGYTAVVRNTATGQAQAHLNAVCVKRTTEAAGNPAHTHDLVVSAPVSTATTLVAGQRKTVTVDCGANQIAIAPSYAFTGAPVRVAASFKTASGWSFTLEGGSDASTASVSIRCLNDRTSDTDGHVHELKSSFVTQTVSVPAGSSYDAPALTCSDTAKGIVASYDLPAGLVNLGNDPQPKTRVFRIYNTTDHPVVATLGLTCLDTKTAGPSAGRRTVDNTATASSDTPDRVAANNVSTASFVLTAGDISAGSGAGGSAAGTGSASTGPSGTGSSGGSGTVTPAPRTGTKAAAAKVDGTSVALTPATSALTVPVTCDAACTGTATVKLDGTLKVAGKTYKAGRTLAVASFDLKAGQAASVKVKLPRKVSVALRRARVRTLTVVLAPTGGTATTTRIKLRLR